MSDDWSRKVRLHELDRGPVRLVLEPSEAERKRIAKELGLERLASLKAELTVKPWLDGAEITGRFRAVVGQLCSVSAEAFEQPVSGDIDVRVVPSGSANTPQEDAGHEVELELDAPDPPDVLESDAVDPAGYVVEHLALEIDPFPRKPGATFDYAAPTEEASPFAVLKNLKAPKP